MKIHKKIIGIRNTSDDVILWKTSQTNKIFDIE